MSEKSSRTDAPSGQAKPRPVQTMDGRADRTGDDGRRAECEDGDAEAGVGEAVEADVARSWGLDLDIRVSCGA
ncbi:hypothetical protein ACH4FE_32190 [Streptomyces celluloflavus]|uniref:hypothetical protein n=1 Tax=Streptomyces celluloflavus TaxID=58344 RepID=UPI0037A69482